MTYQKRINERFFGFIFMKEYSFVLFYLLFKIFGVKVRFIEKKWQILYRATNIKRGSFVRRSYKLQIWKLFFKKINQFHSYSKKHQDLKTFNKVRYKEMVEIWQMMILKAALWSKRNLDLRWSGSWIICNDCMEYYDP